jgi:hypothetical protein
LNKIRECPLNRFQDSGRHHQSHFFHDGFLHCIGINDFQPKRQLDKVVVGLSPIDETAIVLKSFEMIFFFSRTGG